MTTFETTAFTVPSFSAAAYIKEQRARGTDLAVLRKDLGRHHRALNEELGTLIQAELPRLVQLTKELSTTEDALRGLCTQITGYQDGTAATTAEVGERLSRFSGQLEERLRLEAELEELQLLRRLAEALGEVERLLAAPPPSDAHELACYAAEGTPRPLLELLAEADTLCRAAAAFGQVRLLARRGAEAALVQRSQGRIDVARERLVGRLQQCLGVSLEAGCNEPVRDCLRACAEAGCVDEAYAWLRSEWVAPRLRPQLEQAAADVRHKAVPALVAATLAFARSRAFAPLLQPELAASSPPLHLLTHALWTEVTAFLTTETPQFFGAGIPDAFQSAYRCLTGLQAQLEGLLASPQQRRYMRAHPASQDFARRFNLPIYFQLRVQELTKALDAALLPRGTPLPAAAPEPEPEPEPGDGQRPLPPPPPPLATAAALALVSAVRRCFSPSVLLTPLSARFLRLALQTVARFSEWLLTLAPPATDAAASSTATPTASAAAATPSSAAAAADGAAAAEQGTVLSLYTPLHFDLGAVVGWLTTLAPQLPALLQLPASGPAASLGAECSAALAEATGAITTADLALRSAMIAQQAEQCAAHLATGVRAIAASYRMTGKAAPTAPSFFLPEVLKPLRTFLAATDGGQRLAPPARVAWARDVAAAVCGHYLSLAATTLDTVRKNEEALRRLRKAEAAEKPSQLNDSHKICVQLCLDVAAFGEQVGAMGVEVATLDAFAQLQQTVRPDEALLAASLG